MGTPKQFFTAKQFGHQLGLRGTDSALSITIATLVNSGLINGQRVHKRLCIIPGTEIMRVTPLLHQLKGGVE